MCQNLAGTELVLFKLNPKAYFGLCETSVMRSLRKPLTVFKKKLHDRCLTSSYVYRVGKTHEESSVYFANYRVAEIKK